MQLYKHCIKNDIHRKNLFLKLVSPWTWHLKYKKSIKQEEHEIIFYSGFDTFNCIVNILFTKHDEILKIISVRMYVTWDCAREMFSQLII